jgi:hypothetical protein
MAQVMTIEGEHDYELASFCSQGQSMDVDLKG